MLSSHFKHMSLPCGVFRRNHKFYVHENLLFAVMFAGIVEISDIKTHKVVGTLNVNPDALAFFQVQGDFFCAAGNNKAEIWRISTGQCIHSWEPMANIDFFKVQGDLFCIGSKTGQVKIWNIRTAELIFELSNEVHITIFKLCGNFLFLEGLFPLSEGGSENVIKAWDIPRKCVVNIFRSPPESPLLSWMHDLKVEGEFLVVMAPGLQEIGIWNATTAEFLHSIKHDECLLRSARCHVQGHLFLAVGSKKARAWDIRTGKLLYELEELRTCTPRFSVCGDFLITFPLNQARGKVWDILRGRRIGTFSCQGAIWLGPHPQTGGDFLCIDSEKGILAWDLLPHPSVYELELLKNNLKILEQDEWAALLEKLDPRIRWHLERTDPPCLKRVQTIVRLELLLHAVYDQDEERTCALLDELSLNMLFEENTSRREKIQAVQALLADLY
jgi:WD40 repeat protein